MRSRFRSRASRGWLRQLFVASFLVAGGAAPGCYKAGGADEDDPGSVNEACLSNRDYFAQKVWAPVMSKICLKCHGPDGIATDANAKLTLLPGAYPGFLDANLKSVTEVAKTEYDGKSVLLRKPLGEMDHGGKEQITEGSPE